MANTELHDDRKLTKSRKGYNGTRKFYGPQSTIVSDLPSLGDPWPQDYAYSGWTNVSDCVVTSIDLEHKFGQTDALATVNYSTSGEGSKGEGETSTRTRMLTTRIEKLNLVATEDTEKLNFVFKDQDGLEIHATKRAEIPVPMANLRQTMWVASEPSISSLLTIVNKINSVAWEGLAASNWLCTNAGCTQTDDNYELTFEWIGLCDTPFHWNQTIKIPNTKDEYYRWFNSTDFEAVLKSFNGGSSYSTDKWVYQGVEMEWT